MPQARQRLSAGGVNRLEERLWPSSPAFTSLARRAGGTASPIRSTAWVSDQQINPRMLKVNRFDRNVNRCFSGGFMITCTLSSLYL